jgi:hypothetical protein
MMWRRTLHALGKLAAGVLVATLVMELAVRSILATPLKWVLPVPPIPLYEPDPTTRVRHRPHVSGMWLTEHRAFMRTSNLGLRDRDREIAHPGVPRVVVVGDSYVEADQVEWPQTAVAVAERLVARDIPGAEVVNLGLHALPATEVVRLQYKGMSLKPDLAVVMLLVDALLSPEATDDSDIPAYRLGPDGEFHVSFGFRETRRFRMRARLEGPAFNWILDHSELARVVYARQGTGWLAELAQPTLPPASTAWACSPTVLDTQAALWLDGRPAEARAVFDAFIRDLSAIAQSDRLPIVVATRGVEARCPALAAKRAKIIEVMRAKVEAAGLQFADLDPGVVRKVGEQGVSRLSGFGSRLGYGHFNVEGNRVYGEVLADVIREALPAR